MFSDSSQPARPRHACRSLHARWQIHAHAAKYRPLLGFEGSDAAHPHRRVANARSVMGSHFEAGEEVVEGAVPAPRIARKQRQIFLRAIGDALPSHGGHRREEELKCAGSLSSLERVSGRHRGTEPSYGDGGMATGYGTVCIL